MVSSDLRSVNPASEQSKETIAWSEHKDREMGEERDIASRTKVGKSTKDRNGIVYNNGRK